MLKIACFTLPEVGRKPSSSLLFGSLEEIFLPFKNPLLIRISLYIFCIAQNNP
jgi:hypothetical protein